MSRPRLNRLLTLEEAARSPDDGGGHRLSWQVLGQLWAEVTPGTGVERAGEFVTLASVPFQIVVRAAPVGSPSRPRPEHKKQKVYYIYATGLEYKNEIEPLFICRH
ncbi:MAG TPA: head-tail adaptor protein [Paenirhodobacter sp.]